MLVIHDEVVLYLYNSVNKSSWLVI